MKNFRAPLLYALIAALLGGYIYFFERGPVKKKDEEKKLKFFDNFIADDITQIHLENLETTITAYKSPLDIQKDEKGVWRIVSPKKVKADESVVRSLLTGVGDFAPESSIENPKNLAEFGFEKPTVRGVFRTKAGGSFEVIAGDKNAAGTSSYAQCAGKNILFLLPAASLDGLKRNVEDFRDHTFIKTDLVLAKRIVATKDGKVLELEKDKNNIWNILEPFTEKADETKVRDLLTNLNGLRIESFVKDNPDSLAGYGLSKPRVKIEVWPSDGGDSKAIWLGHQKEKATSYYAKSADLPAVYLVPEFFGKADFLKAQDFRDRSVMKFDPAAVKSISVRRGAKTTLYQKGDKGQWVAEGRVGANDEGANIVTQLSQTTIADFAPQGAVTGLRTPSFVVELTLGDNHSRLFRFGNREKSQVYLASDKTKDVYLVSSAVVSQLEVYFSAILTPVPAASPVPPIKK